MSDRDELAAILHGKGAYCGTCGYEDGQCSDCSEVLGGYADAILAAGYRKPRTITTVAELESLTPGTRFLAHGTFYTRVGPSRSARSEFGEEFRLSEFEYSGFTATVIHEPQP